MSDTEAIALGAAQLAKNGVPDPQREARMLWRAAARKRDETVEVSLSDDNRTRCFFRLIERRCTREPMSHLLGYRDFYAHRFEVSAAALDPRPETETLVAAALELPFERVLDLGTGSGCILLSLLAARAPTTGVGTDISHAALAVARRNRALLALDARAELVLSDWFQNLSGQFDLIVSNPPYIAKDEMAELAPELGYEPRLALTDEADGLSAYRAITTGAGAHLSAGGFLMVEIGWRQGPQVSELFMKNGFDDVKILPDLDGRDRVIQGRWCG